MLASHIDTYWFPTTLFLGLYESFQIVAISILKNEVVTVESIFPPFIHIGDRYVHAWIEIVENLFLLRTSRNVLYLFMHTRDIFDQ